MKFIELLFIISLIPLGYLLKTRGLVSEKQAGVILKYVFLVLVPMLLLGAVPGLQLTAEAFLLPFIGIGVALGSLLIAWIVFRKWEDPAQRGVALTGAMIANTGFVIAFVVTLMPPEALPLMLLVDTGGALMTFTVAYAIACKHGSSGRGIESLKKFFSSPPLWALSIGILMSIYGLRFPEEVESSMLLLGKLAGPCIAFALGVRLYFTSGTLKKSLGVVAVRILGGGGVAMLLVLLFDLEGFAQTVVILGGFAPVGYNSLVFAAQQKLDENLAAQGVSISLIISLVTIPLIILLLP